MNANQDISVRNYMDTFYLCRVGKDRLCENMVEEHSLIHIVSGEMDVILPEGKTLHFRKGDTCLLRRNHKVKKDKHPDRNGNEFKAVIIHLAVDFLKKTRKEYKIAIPSAVSENTVESNAFVLPRHAFLESLFSSLLNYFKLEQYPSNELMDSKLRETVFTILQLKPSLAAVLFDYMQPWRIDLEAFMQSNFKSDLTIEQFAHYTGRSLTAFKNDFDSIFHLTPQRWLTKRRLQEARKLMENTGEKPLDIYLEVGFKSLSHFSTAFKKEYGIPPSQLLLTVE